MSCGQKEITVTIQTDFIVCDFVFGGQGHTFVIMVAVGDVLSVLSAVAVLQTQRRRLQHTAVVALSVWLRLAAVVATLSIGSEFEADHRWPCLPKSWRA